ncbi:MAG: methyl-accepting chemotaxis protein [Thermodesulfobacteriota bacterium]
MSVRARLVIAISLLLLFMLIAGTGGLVGMYSINQSFNRVYNQKVLPLATLRSLNELIAIDLVRAVDGVLYEEISLGEGARQIDRIEKELQADWERLYRVEDMGFLVKKADWLADARQLKDKTDQAFSELRSLLKTSSLEGFATPGKMDRLDELHDKKLTPLINEYREQIGILFNDRMEATSDQLDSVKRQYQLSRLAFFLTICLALLAGIAVGYYLLKSISNPLAQLASVFGEVMQGNLTGRIAAHSQDEFGVLTQGFNQMLSYLRDLIRQIQQSGIQVTSSITEIAAATKEQEATANEHAATTSEIAASATEISATSHSLLQAMKRLNSLTKNTAYATEEGHKGLVNINQIMSRMEAATGDIVDKLSILNEKAANVAGVVKTINKVADQTNLLSLNAAIEAEKAGEYGAGFSVVATEIRRLADQTSVATFDIEQMVQDVQSSVSAAVMGIDKFAEDVRRGIGEIQASGSNLSHVLEQVDVLVPNLNTMNEGIEAQSLGARQISDAISQLNEAAQQTAETLAQNSGTIGQLQDAARGLQDAIARFRIES